MENGLNKTDYRNPTEDLLALVVQQVDDFIVNTEDARAQSERDRDYKDHKQWTAAEAAKLKKRGQAPIVVNRVKPKVDGLLGLLAMRSTDPKAYPRTKKHEKSAEAVTDGLRYVADDNDFNDSVKQVVAEDVFVEGYGGAIVSVEQKGQEMEVTINPIHWDRIYFDVRSRKRDFSDARYMGIIQWMSPEEIKEKYPDVDVNELIQTGDDSGDTHDDRPTWVSSNNKRIKIALHFWIKDGVWWFCTFSKGSFLIEPTESPFFDEYGQPTNPIELVGAYIDRDNNRYGEVRGFISQQDEINHRRSKALHLLSQRQTFGRRGEVKDVAALKRELAKPDGHIEFQGETFGKDFGILPTGDMAQGQIQLYQDAKIELDAVSFNAQLSGERQSGDLSGKAIDRLQQAGTMELNGLFSALNTWEKRIYRQVWARIKQFWTEEKWIRVTDDQDSLRWIGFNTQMTAQEWMEEIINDKSESVVKRKQIAASYQLLMNALQGDDIIAAQQAEQVLQRPIAIRNPIPELDMDIILEQSFDTVNIQQEQFEMLAKFAQGSPDINIVDLIELSQLRGKDELIEKIEKRRQEAQQAVMGAAQLQAQDAQAKIRKTMADSAKTEQEAVQKKIQNTLMVANPDMSPQVNMR